MPSSILPNRLHLAAVLLFSFFSLPTTMATPTPKEAAPSIVCVYMCSDINFKGFCKDFCGSPGLCYNVSADYNDVISSVRPTEGQVSGCTIFPDANCEGRVNLDGITYPGYDNLVQQGFNDVVSSWICY